MRWTTVRGFGSVKYFNISYVILLTVPVIFELYTRSAPLMQWIGAPSPFPGTLRWLYAASLCYAIGIALYQYFCPTDIKRFGDCDEYVQSQFELFARAHPQHRIEIVIANLDADIDKEILDEIEHLAREIAESAGRDRADLEDRLDNILKDLHPHAVQSFLHRDFDTKNRSRLLAILLSFACYVAGTIIVLWLLGERSYSILMSGKMEGTVLIQTFFRENLKAPTPDASKSLILHTYVFDPKEFQFLEIVLKDSGIEPTYQAPFLDKLNRLNREYEVSQPQVSSLEKTLEGEFDPSGQFMPSGKGGNVYACREVLISGSGKGCEELIAPNSPIAKVRCGMIANKRKWLGGAANPGTCYKG